MDQIIPAQPRECPLLSSLANPSSLLIRLGEKLGYDLEKFLGTSSLP